MKNSAIVVGAGLAGAEAAWQLAKRGIHVTLYDMKPGKKTPAHIADTFAELVCSNSLRADKIQNAVGLLKEEMRRLDSLIISAADNTRVPAGGALAVDRDEFSQYVTKELELNENIGIIHEEVLRIPLEEEVIVATGPLTSDALCEDIERLVGQGLYFFDAAAPIVSFESIDSTKVFRASRYGKGDTGDYLNCPMNKTQYFAFVHELIHAQVAEIKGFEKNKIFEGCMPVEVMAARGDMTLAFGPLKPIGLFDPRTGKEPFACVQLRQDNHEGTLFNIVGFQTHLKFPEQKRVFSMIPGLENAEFIRFGVMHRNTFLHSPGKLNANFQLLEHPNIFFAGQITGVEGYVESAASGLCAGISLAKRLQNSPMPVFTRETAIGALCAHISAYEGSDFQPMNISFGLIKPLETRYRRKVERYTAIAAIALQKIDSMKADGEI